MTLAARHGLPLGQAPMELEATALPGTWRPGATSSCSMAIRTLKQKPLTTAQAATVETGTDVSPTPSPSSPDYQRLRLRFRKEGDLRWISHRDLVRTVERLFRRAELALRMSAGFHPKPKMSFPSALALGIEGLGEVMELELVEPVEPQQLLPRLGALAPAGLVITQVEAVATGQRKARIRSMQYQFPVPRERCEQVARAIEKLTTASTLPVQRDGRTQPVDILADLMSVELRDDTVCFGLRATDQASARPRDVLQALGLTDLEQQGQFLTRLEVELAS